jgi:hypothetical protein
MHGYELFTEAPGISDNWERSKDLLQSRQVLFLKRQVIGLSLMNEISEDDFL